MSYQVLARKYRPKSFDSLVGQEHVVRALTHALEQKRLHHAYLFTGTRGVGKTTLSRILAKSLNCQGADGGGDITAQPCGVCEACTAIDAGRFVDYIEMDAASNRGVDEMAQLLEQAVYAPSNARFKVYMIDEVHMLTSHAFNAMLKTLEEPPAHVKFILATTDPQKIPVTVLSRCLQFNLKQMPPGHIVGHLENILAQEQIAFDAPALRLLAQGAQGSMRDALSLTDQAIAYAAGKVTLDAVQGMLGALDHTYLVSLLDALAAQDGAALLAIADEMAARSLSWSAALQDLATLLNRIAIAQAVPAAVPDDLPGRDDILRLAQTFPAEDVQLFYQIVVHGRSELGLAPDEYAGFTMTLLRMLSFVPLDGGGQRAPTPAAATVAPRGVPAEVPVAAAAPAPASALAFAPASEPALSAPAADSATRPMSPAMAALAAARSARAKPAPVMAPRPAPTPAPADVSVPSSPPPWEDDGLMLPPVDAIDPAQKKTEQPISAAAEGGDDAWPFDVPPEDGYDVQAPVAAPAVIESEAEIEVVADTGGIDCDWPQLVRQLPLRGVVHQLAMQSELLSCREEGQALLIQIRVPVDTLLSAGSSDKLAAALTTHFGRPVRLDAMIGAVRRTAHAADLADQAERQRLAERTLQDDPFVQTLMRDFGATIVPGSIRPV
jgi:DNA polymerase-3 subunit gamma/tau